MEGHPRIVWAVLMLQIIIPVILLGVRWSDPSLGQLHGGWQMHTHCWGSQDDTCR